MTTGQWLTLLGFALPVAASLWLGLRNNRSLNYTTISERLDKVEKQLQETEDREQKVEQRAGRQGRYIYVLIAALEKHGIDVPPPPESLEELGL